MNIFYLHKMARLCAQYHCDKHVVKMILETAQLLSSVWWVLDDFRAEFFQKSGQIYRKTHANHPCAKWARASRQNYEWLCELGRELCAEYTLRYGRIHKTQAIITFLSLNVPPSLPRLPFENPPKCVGEELSNQFEDTVEAYRHYYQVEKSRFAKWNKGRCAPEWWG